MIDPQRLDVFADREPFRQAVRAALLAALELLELHRPALDELLQQQRRAEVRRVHRLYRARRRGRW